MHLVMSIGGEDHDLVVDLDDPDATVEDLLAALDLGTIGDVGIVHRGRRVGRHHCLADLGVAPGDRVALDDGATTLTEATAGAPALGVVAGPDAGRSVPLDAPVVVGRGASADLRVDDPCLSTRHLRVDRAGRGLQVEDLGSTNGTWIDGHRAEGPVQVIGSEVRAGASILRAVAAGPDDAPTAPHRTGWGRPAVHNRPPRPALDPAPDPIAVPEAPEENRRRPPFNLAALAGPVVMGGAMVLLYGNPRFAMFALLSPVMLIANWISGRRRDRKASRTGAADFAAAVTGLDHDLERRSVAERERLARRHPDPVEVARRAAQPSTLLWERRPAHDDFLELCIGRGNSRWQPVVDGPATPLAPLAGVLERWRHLADAPVTVDLAAGPIGLHGDRSTATALARWLLVQATVHHGPADVQVLVVAQEGHAEEWDWVKWLPHACDPATGRVRLVTDADALDDALERMAPRADGGPGLVRTGRDDEAGPTVLVVVDDPGAFEGRRSPLRSLLRGERGAASGIILAPSEDRLPASCSLVVDSAADGDLTVTDPAARETVAGVLGTGVSIATALEVARSLARFEDAEQQVPGGDLPAGCRLLPLLGLAEPISADAIAERWAAAGPDPAPRAPIGIAETGAFELDLLRDGPHALVAGTTGAGKSELLRTWVASLAATQSPEDLVFVLIDYKGGSAFDECARLPHTVGLVTDLDEHLGERALRSLSAELHHRERELRAAGAPDLADYRRKGSPRGPLPRLVVVVDEFATLAAELPDFLGALVGVAQRGRSLGVHLVLATQRPQGAVNANIKANTNLRIALRVQDGTDSSDIIDRADAAHISAETPGRLFVRRGHGDVVAVQSALSTAPLTAASRAAVTIRPFTARPGTGDDLVVRLGAPDRTELSALVDAVRDAHAERRTPPPRRPWLDMLAETLPWSALDGVEPDPDVPVPVAVGDDPDHQRRVALGWDPAAGNLGIFGMVGSGTTTAVRAVVRSLVERQDPTRVHVHVVDTGGELGPLARLPHVGSVIALPERERLLRLVRMLSSELDRRRTLAPHERGEAPHVVLVVDGFGALVAELGSVGVDGVTEDLQRVVNEGPGVGISTVLAADRPGAIGARYGAALARRMLFRLADPADFGTIGLRARNLPTFVPGRFVEDGASMVGQVLEPGEVWIDAHAGPAPRSGGPDPVRALPAAVDPRELPPAVHDRRGLTVPIAIAEHDLSPVSLHLRDGDHAIVAGPPGSGRSNTLVQVAAQLRATDERIVLVGIADEGSPLHGRPELDAYGTADELAHVLRSGAGDHRRWVVLVDDAGRIGEAASLAMALEARRPGLHVVAAGRPDDFRSHASWTRPLRSSRCGLLLQPDLATDGDVLGARLPRRLPVALVAGRGFVVDAGAPTLAQVALPEPAPELSDVAG